MKALNVRLQPYAPSSDSASLSSRNSHSGLAHNGIKCKKQKTPRRGFGPRSPTYSEEQVAAGGPGLVGCHPSSSTGWYATIALSEIKHISKLWSNCRKQFGGHKIYIRPFFDPQPLTRSRSETSSRSTSCGFKRSRGCQDYPMFTFVDRPSQNVLYRVKARLKILAGLQC